MFRILNHRGGEAAVPTKCSEELQEARLRKLSPPEKRSAAVDFHPLVPAPRFSGRLGFSWRGYNVARVSRDRVVEREGLSLPATVDAGRQDAGRDRRRRLQERTGWDIDRGTGCQWGTLTD